MDDVYKRDFLKEINIKSELLVYDWSNGGEIELVVDDIEKIGRLILNEFYHISFLHLYSMPGRFLSHSL